MTRRDLLVAGLVLALPLFAVACGGSDDDDGNGGVITAPTNVTTRTSTVAGESTRGSGNGSAESSTIEIAADNLKFDKDELTAKANSEVKVTFTNEEAVPHNVAFYRTDKAADQIYVGEIISGPDKTVTYAFTTPGAGDYFFRCDVHPTTMTGDFVVQA